MLTTGTASAVADILLVILWLLTILAFQRCLAPTTRARKNAKSKRCIEGRFNFFLGSSPGFREMNELDDYKLVLCGVTNAVQIGNLMKLLRYSLCAGPSSERDISKNAFIALLRAGGGLDGSRHVSIKQITPEFILKYGSAVLELESPLENEVSSTAADILTFADNLMKAVGKDRSDGLLVQYALIKIRYNDLQSGHDLVERYASILNF